MTEDQIHVAKQVDTLLLVAFKAFEAGQYGVSAQTLRTAADLVDVFGKGGATP